MKCLGHPTSLSKKDICSLTVYCPDHCVGSEWPASNIVASSNAYCVQASTGKVKRTRKRGSGRSTTPRAPAQDRQDTSCTAVPPPQQAQPELQAMQQELAVLKQKVKMYEELQTQGGTASAVAAAAPDQSIALATRTWLPRRPWCCLVDLLPLISVAMWLISFA